jgi:hypothetical protein
LRPIGVASLATHHSFYTTITEEKNANFAALGQSASAG